MTAPEPQRDEPAGEPGPRSMLAAAVVMQGMLALAALAWLWWRDRMDVLPERAVGTHGPFVASACGLACGLVGGFALAPLHARFARWNEVERVVRQTFHDASDTGLALFAIVAAVAEELFFRVAVQDVFGLAGSVAVAAIVNSCVVGWAWLPIAAVQAFVLGALVQHGYGLLASTTANAVTGHFLLRRILCSTPKSS